MKTIAVIPAFNEQETIGSVIRDISAVDETIDILVIDDASRDRTAWVARNSGAKTVTLSSRMGYGVALQTGYKYAFENGYEFLVQLDGDGQHDPAYLPNLLTPLTAGEADLVLGSRFLEKGSRRTLEPKEDVPGLARKVGMKLFASLTSLLVGSKVTDPTSGYQAMNRQVLAFFVRDFFPHDYPDADVILIAHRAGFTTKEIPVVILKRIRGKSMHRGLKPAYYTFKMFLSIFMTLLRRKPPFLQKEKAFKEQFLKPEGSSVPANRADVIHRTGAPNGMEEPVAREGS
jgi:glycosyltransferase involved in cell wall biosynthesis